LLEKQSPPSTAAFSNALQLLAKRQGGSKLTTGSPGLDSLLGGGLSPGAFYLFYGDGESGVDLLLHRLLVNTLLPVERNGLEGEAVYLNCGNYREERTVLDVQHLTALIKANGLDADPALDRIRVFLAFSSEHEEQVVESVSRAVRENDSVRTLVVHNVARLFSPDAQPGLSHMERLERLNRLQGVVSKLWQIAAERGLVMAASCRPRPGSRGQTPQPEGGQHLRHAANVLVYLRRVEAGFTEASLLKHPSRAPGRTRFTYKTGGGELGRITIPFRTRFDEELSNLQRDYREALMNPARREAFDLLVKAVTGEMGAMSHVKIPTVLDVLLLTAVVENRRSIEELGAQGKSIVARLDRLEALMQATFVAPSKPSEPVSTGAPP